MAIDSTGDGLGAPAVDWVAITPHDTNEVSPTPRALYIGVAGSLSVVSRKGNTMTITAVAAGYHPIRPLKVLDTGTDASEIYALY